MGNYSLIWSGLSKEIAHGEMGGACHDNQQTINILHDEIETVFEDVIGPMKQHSARNPQVLFLLQGWSPAKK